MITEPMGPYAARVYRFDPPRIRSDADADDGNLVTNADLRAQMLLGVPDHWLLFPTAGSPPGSMDLQAVLLADHAAARTNSNTTAALQIVLSSPLGAPRVRFLLLEILIASSRVYTMVRCVFAGTGVHIPLSIDGHGLSASSTY